MLRIVVIAAILAAAAWLTKPGEADAEAALRTQLILALANEDLGAGRSAGENIALAACKLSPNDCYDLLRPEIATVFSDFGLFTRVQMAGLGRRATCYGAFTKFVCPGGLKEV